MKKNNFFDNLIVLDMANNHFGDLKHSKKIVSSFSKITKNNIDTAYNHTVWQVSPGFKIDAFNENGTIQWNTKNLIVATGTYEKIIPFDGWTKPGIIGLAACTVMLKSHHFIPSKKIILAGNGPLLMLVAYYIIEFGGEVDAIIDTSSKFDWIKSTL